MVNENGQSAEVDLITPDGFEALFPNNSVIDERAEGKGITLRTGSLRSKAAMSMLKYIYMAHQTAQMNPDVKFFIDVGSSPAVPVFAGDPEDTVAELVQERIALEAVAQHMASTEESSNPATSVTDPSVIRLQKMQSGASHWWP